MEPDLLRHVPCLLYSSLHLPGLWVFSRLWHANLPAAKLHTSHKWAAHAAT